MPSIFSQPRLPKWLQWGLLAVCALLSVVYWAESAHHIQGDHWAQRLVSIGYVFGLHRAQDDALLDPRPEVARGAQPLIDYGGTQFLGCDLALKRDRLQLVTYWSRPIAQGSLHVALRFVDPASSAETKAVQPIDATMLLTALPSDFYADGRRGEVWMRVSDADTEQTTDIIDSLGPLAQDGWMRICN